MDSLLPIQPKSLIDIHVHIASYSDPKTGCYLHPSFERDIRSLYFRWKLKLNGKTNTECNEMYIQKLLRDIRQSKFVQSCVILSLDGVYDEKGELDLSRTKMMISNDRIFSLSKLYPHELLPGASINPQRKDALEELDRVVEKGAVLIKVIPNAQMFDPSCPLYLPFYKKAAEKKIPILTHCGYEIAIPSKYQRFGDLRLWRRALDEGVVLIAAHLGSSGLFIPGQPYNDFIELMETYPNLWADLSGMTFPDRSIHLIKFRHRTDLHHRVLFGTDYPLNAFSFGFIGCFDVKTHLRITTEKNTFDKNALIFKAFGLLQPHRDRQNSPLLKGGSL